MGLSKKSSGTHNNGVLQQQSPTCFSTMRKKLLYSIYYNLDLWHITSTKETLTLFHCDFGVVCSSSGDIYHCEILDLTFCCIEHCSRFSTTSLPVDAVGQWSDEILLRALHDHLTHFMKLLGVVDSTVKLGVGIREFCKTGNKWG